MIPRVYMVSIGDKSPVHSLTSEQTLYSPWCFLFASLHVLSWPKSERRPNVVNRDLRDWTPTRALHRGPNLFTTEIAFHARSLLGIGNPDHRARSSRSKQVVRRSCNL